MQTVNGIIEPHTLARCIAELQEGSTLAQRCAVSAGLSGLDVHNIAIRMGAQPTTYGPVLGYLFDDDSALVVDRWDHTVYQSSTVLRDYMLDQRGNLPFSEWAGIETNLLRLAGHIL